MTWQLQDPNSIQVEPTEGCNLRCGFCGIRGIREKGPRDDLSGPYYYMSVETADSIASQMARAKWNCRVEFAMHGEPTLNPKLPQIVQAFRRHLPNQSIMVTTNAVPMLEGKEDWDAPDLRSALLTLLNAGANTIAIDDYRPHRVAPHVRKMSFPFPVRDYPEDRRGNPHVRFHGYRIIIIQDISEASAGTHARISNHAGAAGPKVKGFNHMACTLPFRDMSVRWDGTVALCCNDWRGEYKMGHADDLVAAWHSKAAYAARRVLLNEGRAGIGPCDGCNFRPTRLGLLPNMNGSGRQELGIPTQVDREAIIEAQAHGSAAPIVLRRWEKGELHAVG